MHTYTTESFRSTGKVIFQNLTPDQKYMKSVEAHSYLMDQARDLKIKELCFPVLEDTRFIIWTGSGYPNHHHYGDGGLVVHTAEVVKLGLLNKQILQLDIDERLIYCSALFHDIGKLQDYERTSDPQRPWGNTNHKYYIHHVTRSSLEWYKAVTQNFAVMDEEVLTPNYEWLTHEKQEQIFHAILSHHGRRENGSPVVPRTQLAWLLHLCDSLSARMDDGDIREYK